MDETADEDLTALLDGRLGQPNRSDVFRRLTANPDLQDRFCALARTRGSLDAAFSAMLAQAPVARMRAALPSRRQRSRLLTPAGARIAASVVMVAFLAAAFAAWVFVNVKNISDDWTTAVVDYMQLYTPETFAGLAPDLAQEAALVEKVGDRLGVAVSPRDLTPADLTFKTAFILSYEGAPLGEFVFADAAGAPYLFCILAETAGPTRLNTDKRQGFTVATWGRRDKRFLLIGPSDGRIRRWAGTLADRI